MIPQEKWRDVIEESAYTTAAFCQHFDFTKENLNRWLNWGVKPRAKSEAKMQAALEKITKEKKIPFCKAYGYATKEPIRTLGCMGLSPDRNDLRGKIEKQQSTGGKKYWT